MAKRDYYEVLEVDKTATLDVIKKHTAKSNTISSGQESGG